MCMDRMHNKTWVQVPGKSTLANFSGEAMIYWGFIFVQTSEAVLFLI